MWTDGRIVLVVYGNATDWTGKENERVHGRAGWLSALQTTQMSAHDIYLGPYAGHGRGRRLLNLAPPLKKRKRGRRKIAHTR